MSEPNIDSPEQFPGRLAEEFIKASDLYIAERRAWLQEQFGQTDFCIRGVVVVGSAAAGKERPDSDVDVYVIVDEGEGDVDDYLIGVSHVINRPVSLLGLIELNRGERFEPEDWNANLGDDYASTIAERGGRPYNTEYITHLFDS